MAKCKWLAAAVLCAASASAQQPTGFALERLYPSAPGGGWFVMDDLNIGGGLGGAVSLTSGYAHNPLATVSSEAMELGRILFGTAGLATLGRKAIRKMSGISTASDR